MAKGRGRGRGRGGFVASQRTPTGTTPIHPSSSRPVGGSTPSSSARHATPSQLPPQYIITPTPTPSPPPLVQGQLNVRDYPPPTVLFQTTSSRQPQISSGQMTQPLNSPNPAPHIPQRRSSSNSTGQMSPPTSYPNPLTQPPEVQSTHASEAEAQQSNELEDDEIHGMDGNDGIDDNANIQPILQEDLLRYLEKLLRIPNRDQWTTVLSPLDPPPPKTTW